MYLHLVFVYTYLLAMLCADSHDLISRNRRTPQSSRLWCYYAFTCDTIKRNDVNSCCQELLPNCPKLTCRVDRTSQCGIENLGKNTRIIGGTVTQVNQYPWMVRLPGCGGALISDRHVLTTKHCLEGRNWRGYKVKVGVHDQSDPNVATVFIKDYEFYNEGHNDLDIDSLAIVLLEPRVNLNNKKIGTVCLPSTTDKDYQGEEALVLGWGYTPEPHLQWTPHPEEPDKIQSKLLQQVQLTVDKETETEYWGYTLPQFNNNGVPLSICRGDSGGPLIHYESGKWTIIGTAIGSNLDCTNYDDDERYHNAYFRVEKFLPWVKNVLEK